MAGKRDSSKEMGFLDHLEELRSVIISIIAVWLGSSIVIWFLSGRLLDFLLSTIPVESLYFNAPVEAFMIRLKLSFVAGFLVSFPFVLFRVWAFVAPGLFEHERRVVFPLILPSAALFYAGVIFAYWVMVPIVLGFLVRFGTEMLAPLISVSKYFEFVARTCFAFGLVFQLPLVIIFLTWSGVVSSRTLLRQWRWAVLAIFVAAAVLTPPDPASQLLMALPLVVLFLASAVLALLIERRRSRREGESPEKGPEDDPA